MRVTGEPGVGARIPRKALVEINDALSRQMGLRFRENRLPDLERGLIRACQELEWGDVSACVKCLQEAKLSRAQVELLASHLTIGETYFFRDPGSFAILEKEILPELIDRRRRTNRILRFWSAGCSSGEEIYSLAMLLRRLIPDWKNWGLTLLGTDMNPSALRKAEEGIYGEWSFRSLSPDFKKRHFEQAGPKRYRIKEEIREMVRFSYLNLADYSYPTLASNTGVMDVIFCRNVLMYFAQDTIRKVTRGFFGSLIDGGWVVTSPAEASARDFAGFETVNLAGAIFFRKSSASPVSVASPSPVPEAPVVRSLERQQEKVRGVGAEDRPPLKRAGKTSSPPALELLAKIQADRGDLPGAFDLCEKAIAADPIAVRLHYLKAGILQEMGDSDSAVAVLRRALFLERRFVMGHFTLANVYRQRGKKPEARRHFFRADELLAEFSPDESPPEAEGLNAARLRQIVAANLRSLND